MLFEPGASQYHRRLRGVATGSGPRNAALTLHNHRRAWYRWIFAGLVCDSPGKQVSAPHCSTSIRSSIGQKEASLTHFSFLSLLYISCMEMRLTTADYRRFMERWAVWHNADRGFRGMPFTQNHVELPSPAIQAREQAFELDATEIPRSLPTVLEPLNETMPGRSSIREPSPDWPLRRNG